MIASRSSHARLVIPCLALLMIAAPATIHAAPGQNARKDDPTPVADKNSAHTPQASNFFSLDSGAQIGLEYRFGIVRNGEVGIHRTTMTRQLSAHTSEWTRNRGTTNPHL